MKTPNDFDKFERRIWTGIKIFLPLWILGVLAFWIGVIFLIWKLVFA